ncbi:heavy metal-associated isoprenylated plant protein 42 [Lactuca sativa]|uniref:heavy metal-associated isoprenylated plant protein 42 n=1 Tax=Lactuca sativa TaxID=4236 RepID=UPI001C68AC94|nr:heavy metal-associated isoprenylated plant protein 42 [Lactuca sativa]
MSMEPCADMECCLKVHSKCESCMMKTIEVLRSISGVYSVTWDAEKNIFKISGEVDPNILLKAVMRTGEHAELVNVKLNHPQLRHTNYNYNYNNHNFGYGYHIPSSSSYRRRDIRPLPEHEFYPVTSSAYRRPPGIQYLPSNYDTTSYGYGYENPLPPATYVPSYPYQEHDPYANYEGVSFCTIM